MEGLKPGRIVYLVLDGLMVDEIERRRTTDEQIRRRLEADPPTWPAGAQAHIGNAVCVGDLVPAMVVRVLNVDGPAGSPRIPEGAVNLQAMLDGTDTYWAAGVVYSAEKVPGTWHWMFEGQNTRYDPTKVTS